MAHPDAPVDPPPSISAAELRRRLLASTPPPLASGTPTTAELDIHQTQAASHPAPLPLPTPPAGSIADAMSRLRLPSQTGPVPAHALPPVIDPVPEPFQQILRRNGRPTGIGALDSSGGMPGLPPEADAMAAGASRIGGVPIPSVPAPSRIESSNGAPGPDDFRRLKSENREFRKLLEEMKSLLQEASDNEQKFAAKEQELQAALAQKQSQIDELTSQLQGIEEQIASGAIAPAPPTPKTRDELEEWADELEKESSKISQERRRLDEERRQLREDEEALERQMREMEVSMARERAMLARQETELKRLSAEIQHELEIMQRGDAALRDQLAKFQRRANEVMQGRPGAGGGKK